MVEIVQNSAAEQKCFLGHKADLIPQHLFGHPQDIHPVDADGAALNIVETGNQVGDGGFSGSSTADDGGGFADVCRKADIVQHRFLRTFILEGNVAKFQLGFRKVLPGLARCHIRIGVDSQHLVDTVGAGLRSCSNLERLKARITRIPASISRRVRLILSSRVCSLENSGITFL